MRADPPAAAAAVRQAPTAITFAIRSQARNRLAAILLVAFVPAWYLLMIAMTGNRPLTFRLFATGQTLTVNGGHLTLITAGLSALTMIVGFAVFHAVHTSLDFDRRLVSAGYRQTTLIVAKIAAIAVTAIATAVYAGAVLLGFWRPSPAGWLAILAALAVISLVYGSLGLLLGVLVRGDLEGFFLIIMTSLVDTFLQNPLGNPLANRPILAWFPSFGPMQFAVGRSLGHADLWGHLALGLAWAAGLVAVGQAIFFLRTRRPTCAA